MSTDLARSDTAARSAPLSLTGDLLRNACAADAHFHERYDLSTWQELGRGAFACVARVYCRDRAEEVAVKVFYCLTEDSRARMRAEVLNAQRAYSELLVRVHTPFSSGDLAWIEMELVRGRNLDQEIALRRSEGRPFTLTEGLELGIAIAEALDAAHRAGVVHRDLKPANLLLPENGKPRIKLGDFGISKFRDAARLTATGEIPGTPQYAAPEVWESKGIGSAADVYSLGLVLFRILATGECAYELPDGASTPQVFVAHKQQAPRRIRRLNPAVPERIEGLILGMLAKDPKARPPLYEVIPVLGIALEGLGAPRMAEPRRQLLRLGPALAGGGAALLLAGTLWVGRRPASATQPGLDARPPLLGTAPGGEATLATQAARLVATPAIDSPPTPQPKRALSPPTPPPRASAPPAPTFQAVIEGPAVAITNVSDHDVSGLTVTLSGGDGARHTALLPDALGPGEVVLLPFGEFDPPVPEGFELKSAAITRENGTPHSHTAIGLN